MSATIPAYVVAARNDQVTTKTQMAREAFIKEAAEDLKAARDRQQQTGVRSLPSKNWMKEAAALGFTPPQFRQEVGKAIKLLEETPFAAIHAWANPDKLEMTDEQFWARAGAEVYGAEHNGFTEEVETARAYWIDRAGERGITAADAEDLLNAAIDEAMQEQMAENHDSLDEQYARADKSVHTRMKRRGDGSYEYETSVRVSGEGIDVIAIQNRLAREADEAARVEAARRQDRDMSDGVFAGRD